MSRGFRAASAAGTAMIIMVATIAVRAQSVTPTLSEEQIAALSMAYGNMRVIGTQKKPTFEEYVQRVIDLAVKRYVDDYRLEQRARASAAIKELPMSVCQKLDTATKEVLAKALDGRAFCGVSAPLDAAVAVEAVR